MRSYTVDPSPACGRRLLLIGVLGFASPSAEALNSGVYRRNLFRLAAQEYIGDSRPQAFFFR